MYQKYSFGFLRLYAEISVSTFLARPYVLLVVVSGAQKFSNQMRKFLDLGGKKWVKNRKNLQKCALFDPVFCTPPAQMRVLEARGS